MVLVCSPHKEMDFNKDIDGEVKEIKIFLASAGVEDEVGAAINQCISVDFVLLYDLLNF